MATKKKKFKRQGWIECIGPEGQSVYLNIRDRSVKVDAAWVLPNGNLALIIGAALMQVQQPIEEILGV